MNILQERLLEQTAHLTLLEIVKEFTNERLANNKLELIPNNKNTFKVKYLMWEATISYYKTFDTPEKYIKYLQKKIPEAEKQYEKLIQEKQNTKLNEIYSEQELKEQLLEKLTNSEEEVEIASLFDGDITRFNTFIKENNILPKLDEETKDFVISIMKNPTEELWAKDTTIRF